MKAEQATFVRSGSRADKSTTCENPEQDVISSFRFRRHGSGNVTPGNCGSASMLTAGPSLPAQARQNLRPVGKSQANIYTTAQMRAVISIPSRAPILIASSHPLGGANENAAVVVPAAF